MEATNKKGFWIILIIFVLIVVAVQVALPRQESTNDANLVIKNQSDQAVGSIVVEYPRWDGSLVSEGATKADNSAIEKGDSIYFFKVRWPAVVTVYADTQGSQPLAQITIAEAPQENCRWKAEIYDLDGELSVSLACVPKE